MMSNSSYIGLLTTNLLTISDGNRDQAVPESEGAHTPQNLEILIAWNDESGRDYVRSTRVDANGDRTGVSVSESEGKHFWHSACGDLKLDEEL